MQSGLGIHRARLESVFFAVFEVGLKMDSDSVFTKTRKTLSESHLETHIDDTFIQASVTESL